MCNKPQPNLLSGTLISASITLFPPLPTCVIMDNSFACGYLSKVFVKMVVTTRGGGLDQCIRVETLYIKTTQFPPL